MVRKSYGGGVNLYSFFFVFFLVDSDIYRGDGISTESEFESPASGIGLHCFLASFSLYLLLMGLVLCMVVFYSHWRNRIGAKGSLRPLKILSYLRIVK